MKVTPKDVLARLAPFKTGDGIEPLKAGYIQDVAVEPHAQGLRISIHVDQTWRGSPVSDQHRRELEAYLRLQVPDALDVRIIPRSKQQADTARKIARPGQAPPRTPDGVKIVAVLSGKGGVGKSTVSINLARAFALLGFRTALLDCDVYGFSVPDLLHLTAPVKVQGHQFLPPSVHGMDVMSMKFFVDQNAPVMWRGPLLGKAIRQMMEDTEWNRPEYMVLDLPPGTGDIAMDVHEFFPRAAALVVTTPDPHAAQVAERAGRMAQYLDRRLLGVVENLSDMTCPHCGDRWYPLGQGGADHVADSLNAPVLARIPWVIAEGAGVSGLVPDNHPAQAVYRSLAKSIHALELAATGSVGQEA